MSNNNYQDAYSRYHHRPITAADPFPSNNGWLFSAYAQKLGLPTDRNKLEQCYAKCRVHVWDNHNSVRRNPGENVPPLSRDEILGIAALNLPFTDLYRIQNWNFSPYPLPRFNLFTFIKQAKLALDHSEDRNYFWKTGLSQLYRFAFSVPLVDRAFILKQWGSFRWYKPSHLFYELLARADKAFTRNPNGLDWLKYGTEKGFTQMLLDDKIPQDHPFRKA